MDIKYEASNLQNDKASGTPS